MLQALAVTSRKSRLEVVRSSKQLPPVKNELPEVNLLLTNKGTPLFCVTMSSLNIPALQALSDRAAIVCCCYPPQLQTKTSCFRPSARVSPQLERRPHTLWNLQVVKGLPATMAATSARSPLQWRLQRHATRENEFRPLAGLGGLHSHRQRRGVSVRIGFTVDPRPR